MSEQRDKIAILINHWIEHNEGHRQSYLEWREKLADEGLPETLAALERVADLTTEANDALGRAAAELAALGSVGRHEHAHGHDAHDHGGHHSH